MCKVIKVEIDPRQEVIVTQGYLDDVFDRINKLQKSITDFREGNYKNPKSYRADGQCPHDVRWWAECCDCDEEYWQTILPKEEKI